MLRDFIELSGNETEKKALLERLLGHSPQACGKCLGLTVRAPGTGHSGVLIFTSILFSGAVVWTMMSDKVTEMAN